MEKEIIEKSLPQTQSARTLGMMLKQLRIKEIDLEEYLIKCAYWGIKTINDVYFRSLPSRPLEVVEYEQLSYSQRKRLGNSYFVDNPEVVRYYDQKRWVETQNKTSLLGLESIKEYLPKSDIKNHSIVDTRIADFRLKMEEV